MNRQEVEKLEGLRVELAAELAMAAKSGDLSEAQAIKGKLDSIFIDLSPAGRFIKEIQPWVEKGEVKFLSVEAGGQPVPTLLRELTKRMVGVGKFARELMYGDSFGTLYQRKKFDLVSLKVKHLGLKSGSTIMEIYERALELGLQICPPELGPELILRDEAWFGEENIYLGMSPVKVITTDLIFKMVNYSGDMSLIAVPAWDNIRWSKETNFVFRVK